MEIKIYEKLGVRKWKKFLIWFMLKITSGRKFRCNYFLGQANIESVEDYKSMIIFNTVAHISALAVNVMYIISDILTVDIFGLVFQIVWLVINLYCIMLQRYNWLRVKKVLSRVTLK